ncbi:MAG: pyridoxal-phosphate-dependent aminotransferase family protein [Anaerolineales bacterium]
MPMFVPGPVDVHPEVADAQTAPMLPHRSVAFEEIFHRAENKARKLFYTQYRVFLTASSGTGFHEAAVRNFVPDNGRILSCTNGAFGNRWHDVALANGKQADRLETDWSQPITPERVAGALKQRRYDIITVVHNETSTGLMNPVKEIAEVVHDLSPDTLICVDAVSSLSGAKIEMDAWGLDLVLTSSQKALALPPGLGLGAVSDRALARAETVPNRGWYFDLVRLEKHRNKNSTPATPAVSLIYALDKQLDRILYEEGLENRFARHSAMAGRVQRWALDRGLGLFAAAGYRSQTVTTVCKSEDLNIGDLNAFLLERDMRIAGGYGPLKPTTFRIAHMGELQMADIERLLEAIDEGCAWYFSFR